jgi:hypothetical protein
MSVKQYADDEGRFDPTEPNDQPCPKCGGPTEYRRWHSGDGAFVDVQVICKARCGWSRWYEGIDS